MRKFIAQNIGLPLNDLVKGYRVRSYYHDFSKFLHTEYAGIQQARLAKFQNLLYHAYEHTAFYRRRLDTIGATPADFRSLDAIRQIPPLTRADLQENWREMISDFSAVKHLHKGSSSGSTGSPVNYFYDNSASSAGDAALYLCWSLAGWRLGMKGLHIWGNPTTVKNEWARPFSRIKAWIFNHAKFPAFQLTDPARMEDLAEWVITGNFDFIDGYTNAIYLLAEHMRHNRQTPRKPLKMVLTTAENLHEYQREAIENTLGPVYDLYGCGEIQGVAHECKICKKYHVIDPHVFLEYGAVVDEYSNRELIMTDLDNFAFPLIRYQNGDAGREGEPGTCPVPFSTMEQVSGRQSDIITLPGGGTLSVPSFFGSMLLKKVKGILKYQIEKDRHDHLTIRFVTTGEFEEKDTEIINEALNYYLDGKIYWTLAFVDDIPVSETGKYKLVIDKTVKK